MAYPFQHQNTWPQRPPASPPYPVYQQPPPQSPAPYPTYQNYPASPPYPAYGSPGYPPQGSPAPPPGQNSPYGYAQPPPPHGYFTPPPVGYGSPPPQQGYSNNLQPPPPLQAYNSFPQSNDPWRQQRPPTPQPPPSNLPPPPPTASQGFGYGAPADYQFQYSLCNGRRKALMIGINYIGQKNALKGCINDVKNMSAFLSERYGYRREDMVLLTDDASNPRSQPTKANIIKAMQWLVDGARKDDSLFFHFSGHGGQTRDQDGDEDDGYDEVIYPVDYKSAGHIVDDDMHRIMVMPLSAGVRLTAIFDSCHSGTALDLPYVYSTQGVVKQPNLAKEFGLGLLGSVLAYQRGDVKGAATAAIGLLAKFAGGQRARDKAMRTKTSPADVVMWSGSKDSQTSSDAVEDGENTGAMSWAFQRALRRQPQQSYIQLLNSIRHELERKYTQKPQLSCSHPLDVNLLFVM